MMLLWVHILTAYVLLEAKLATAYLYPYESESRETRSLNGLWDFKISPEDNADIGFTKAWHSEEFSQLGDYIKMPVPASFNDITTNKTIRDYIGWVWYQRSFYIPKRWLQEDIRVFIHFGSVHYLAVIFLNGKKVGEHEGGHLPFQIELPRTAVSINNILTVAVNNTLTLFTVPQGELKYPNDTTRYPKGYKLYSHDFDYVDYAGINRPVILYTTPKVYISGITVTTNIHEELGEVTYLVSTSDDAECEARLYDKTHSLVAQASGCQGKLVVHNAHLWWPAMTCGKIPGYLYDLEVTLSSSDNPDTYTLPVGIRTVSWTNTDLLVNNQIVYLRGFGMHEDASIRGRGFDYAILARDLSLISWIGANAIRTSHYPYAEETLNEADDLGILVILEAPACSLKGFDEELYKNHEAYVKEMIDIHKNRPSVIMWSLANEPVTNSEKANKYFKNLSVAARSYDLTRPVTFVGSQPIVNESAAQHMDVICVNRYRGWYSDSGHTDLIEYQVLNEMTAWHEKYSKPVLVTEYGADSVPGFHTLPETMYTEDYQAVTHLNHFTAFDKLRHKGAIAGELLWNFIDFKTPQEYARPGGCYKGLFTRERQPKQAAHTVRKRHFTLGKCADQ